MSAFIESIEDPAISTLPAVLNPVELCRRLRERLPWQIDGLTETQVRPLRHHAGKRCVVEIALRTVEGPLRLIGKVYSTDHSEVYRLMKVVSAAGFAPGEEFSIPPPVAYIDDLQLLLQERVEGKPSTESFLSDDESIRKAAAERCALWLARFHAMAPRVGSSFDLGSHLLAIEKWFLRVVSLERSLADKAGALFRGLEYASSRLQPNEMVAVHGDYTHHQVILGQGSTVATDWDNYGVADPARDVARFIVGLQRFGLRFQGFIGALDGPVQIFLKAYVAAGRFDVSTRLPFQRAAVCLEHAKHDVHKRADGASGLRRRSMKASVLWRQEYKRGERASVAID